MKNYKYIGLLLLSIGFASCDVNNELDPILEEEVPQVTLNTNGLDFSKYVAVGASFSGGFADGALFKAGQENSFPNILAGKFDTEFNQPLMEDNIGGFVFGGAVVQPPRLYFNGAGPVRLPAMPTTNLLAKASGTSFNNFGIPGAKSFHILAPNYGNPAGILAQTANPYFARMASTPSATVLGDAMGAGDPTKVPTFFTLSEIGGNDVLSYATSGGSGVDQSPSTGNPTGNLDPSTYGGNDITNPLVFDQVFRGMVATMTSTGAKGVIATVPDITLLPFFTTVPYNPVPMDEATSTQLNTQLLGPVIQILTAFGQPDRIALLEVKANNRLLIKDESLVNFAPQISGALQQAGIPAAQAGLMGSLYGQARHATADDLLVLPLSSVIGTEKANIPAPFNVQGVTFPLEDNWTVTSNELASINAATDAYNTIINDVASSNDNVALIDLNAILREAAGGIEFDNYTLTTGLVTGGLVSLDGIHLTGRGYALMANRILGAIDAKFGSNFTLATDGLAKADDYPTNYSPSLQ